MSGIENLTSEQVQQLMNELQQIRKENSLLQAYVKHLADHTLENSPLGCQFFKPNKPALFTGQQAKTSIKVDDWLFQCCQYFEVTNMPGEQQVVFAATLLHDNAATW